MISARASSSKDKHASISRAFGRMIAGSQILAPTHPGGGKPILVPKRANLPEGTPSTRPSQGRTLNGKLWWQWRTRTSDLTDVSRVLQPTELIARLNSA